MAANRNDRNAGLINSLERTARQVNSFIRNVRDRHSDMMCDDDDENFVNGISTKFKRLNEMSETQVCESVDDLFPDRFNEGFTISSISMKKQEIPRFIQSMIAYHVIQPQKMVLDQFIEGLKIGHVLETLRLNNAEELYSLFRGGSDASLTAETLEQLIEFDYSCIDARSNQMMIAQSIEQGFFLLLQSAESGEAKFHIDEMEVETSLSSILQWLTGATRVPAIGFSSKIEIKFSPDYILPRVNTCSLQLFMPLLYKFVNPENVMRKLVEWITNSVGFGLV